MENDYTLLELRNLARGKFKGFTKMNKKDLYDELVTREIISEKEEEEEELFSPGGIDPPDWDFDHLKPIPDFLLPYNYLYTAGSSVRELKRFFIVPDNFTLTAKTPLQNGTREEFIITVGDWHNLLGNDYYYQSLLPAQINGKEVLLMFITFTQLNNRTNYPAPKIGSAAWYGILGNHLITNTKGGFHDHVQLRYQYKIISHPNIFPPPPLPKTD